MSIKLMSRVWENGPEDQTEILVLLALADCANDDGSSCFPSMKTIAQRARLTRRGAQKVVRRLDDAEYISVKESAGPGGVNHYQIHPETLQNAAQGKGEHSSRGGERDSPRGANGVRGGGERDDGKGRTTFAHNHHEPSYNRQRESAHAREGDSPCSLDEAIEIGEDVGVGADLCREWWHYHNERGWPRPVASIESALERWRQNDQKFNGRDESQQPADELALECGGHHWGEDGTLRTEDGRVVTDDRGQPKKKAF